MLEDGWLTGSYHLTINLVSGAAVETVRPANININMDGAPPKTPPEAKVTRRTLTDAEVQNIKHLTMVMTKAGAVTHSGAYCEGSIDAFDRFEVDLGGRTRAYVYSNAHRCLTPDGWALTVAMDCAVHPDSNLCPAAKAP